jgi:hypothetical protein
MSDAYNPEKNGAKKQKKIMICRVPPRAPSKEAFAGC